MRQRGRRWLNSAFGRDLQGAFERKLNLACGFLPRLTMRHDAGPFDYLGDEAFVAFFGRIPNPDFIISRIALHGSLQRVSSDGGPVEKLRFCFQRNVIRDEFA